LFCWCRCFYENHSALFSLFNVVIKAFGVTSEARETVEVTVFVRKIDLFKLCITIFCGRLHLVVEDSNLVTIEYLDAAVLPQRMVCIIVPPVLISKEAKALADTTGAFLSMTLATSFAISY